MSVKRFLILIVLTACAGTRPPSPALFDMHSGSWLNLHLRLHYAATGRRPMPPDAPPPPDGPEWTAAVEYYRARFGERGGMGLIFDDELVALSRHLSTLGSELTGVDAPLAEHLRAVATQVDWQTEDARNRAWMKSLEPLLREHGAALRAELTAVYGVAWPKQPIRVDVSCFGGPVGAYTVDDPPHTIISSCHPGFRGDAALEMIFHEASHVLIGPVERKLEASAKRLGRPIPEDLWHAVLFYTAGACVRRRVPDYVPYATRNDLDMVQRLVPALRQTWQPYLDRKTSLDEAIDALVLRASARTW